MPFPQQNLYKDVFGGVVTEDANSIPVLAADFPEIQFYLSVGAILTIDEVDGVFEVGEKVTGDDSGATGTVLSVSETELVVYNVVGTFTTSDTALVGSESGATAEVTAVGEPDFEIQAFKSNQDNMNPPDPSLPAGPGNEYTQIMYTGENGGVNYEVANPYNPTDSTVNYNQESFRFYTNGAMWVFLRIANYSAGVATKVDINLFNEY